MADVTFTVAADEAKAYRAFQKVIDKQRAMGNAAKEAGQKSRRAGEEGSKGFKGMALSMGSALAGTLTLTAAVNELKRAYTLMNEERKKTAESGEKTVGTLQSHVAGAGDMRSFTRIRDELRSTTAKGADLLTMDERGAVYGGVRGSLPNAPLGDVLSLTKHAMGSRLIYGDTQSTARFGSVMGNVSKLMPGKSVDDVGDITQLLMTAAGKRQGELDKTAFKALHQLTGQGMPAEKALGLLTASFESEQGSRGLVSYASYQQQLAEGRKGVLSPAAKVMLDEFNRGDYVESVRRAQTRDMFAFDEAAASRDPYIRAARKKTAGDVSGKLEEFDDSVDAMVYQGRRSRALAHQRDLGRGAYYRWGLGVSMDVGITNPAEAGGDLPTRPLVPFAPGQHAPDRAGGGGGVDQAQPAVALAQAARRLDEAGASLDAAAKRMAGSTMGPANDGDSVGDE